jgi:hypothetical protein
VKDLKGMECGQCDRLRLEYERLERAYAAAIDTLTTRSDTAPAAEYIRLRTFADDARLDSEVARLELEKHKRIHSRAN